MLVLEECPFCHKLFSAEQVSKEEVDSNMFNDQRIPMETPRIAVGRYAPRREPTDLPERDVITYKITYRCKHCGKEWTKMTRREVDIPRSYVVDEEEKTDDDTVREEDKAREEQYLSEE